MSVSFSSFIILSCFLILVIFMLFFQKTKDYTLHDVFLLRLILFSFQQFLSCIFQSKNQRNLNLYNITVVNTIHIINSLISLLFLLSWWCEWIYFLLLIFFSSNVCFGKVTQMSRTRGPKLQTALKQSYRHPYHHFLLISRLFANKKLRNRQKNQLKFPNLFCFRSSKRKTRACFCFLSWCSDSLSKLSYVIWSIYTTIFGFNCKIYFLETGEESPCYMIYRFLHYNDCSFFTMKERERRVDWRRNFW